MKKPARIPAMKMTKVKSSNIEAIGYDARRFHLFVEFKATDRSPAKTFVYYDVNHVEFNSLLQAESIGKVFHSTIKSVKEGCLYEPEKPKLTKDEIIGMLETRVELLRDELSDFANNSGSLGDEKIDYALKLIFETGQTIE